MSEGSEKDPGEKAKEDTGNNNAPDKNSKKSTQDHRPKGDCASCGRLARTFCSSCKHVFYCRRECQRGHWKDHKEDCRAMAKLPYRCDGFPHTVKYSVSVFETIIA